MAVYYTHTNKEEHTMRKTINLTQHTPAQEQTDVFTVPGLYDQDTDTLESVSDLLTFDNLPTQDEMNVRANKLALLASRQRADKALIGGAPFFMSTLENALIAVGVTPVYAFSQRQSVEVVQEDGTVVKTNVFKHLGYVEVKKRG
jgi:hypothetical protein